LNHPKPSPTLLINKKDKKNQNFPIQLKEKREKEIEKWYCQGLTES
jgi:hypothetical protein